MEAYEKMLSLSRVPDEEVVDHPGQGPGSRNQERWLKQRKAGSPVVPDASQPPAPGPALGPAQGPRGNQTPPAPGWPEGQRGNAVSHSLLARPLLFTTKLGHLILGLGLVLSLQPAPGHTGRLFPSYSQAKSIDPIPIMYPALC